MSIYYSLIARASVVLVDYTDCDGNFREISHAILQNVDIDKNTMCSYSTGQYLFHLVIHDGLIYLCMADKELKKSLPYAYLNEERAPYCAEHELDRDFSSVLSQQMKRYNKGEGDGISNIRKDVSDVKSIMTQNIGKVLERGDRLDVLLEKTDHMSRSSESFAWSARKLQNKTWWENKKICLIISMVTLAFLTIGILVVLYVEKVI